MFFLLYEYDYKQRELLLKNGLNFFAKQFIKNKLVVN
jgi:hypothetical protein